MRLVLVSIALMSSTSLANASQILFSLEHMLGGAQAPFAAADGLQLILQYEVQEPPLGSGLLWEHGSNGSYDFSAGNTPNFAQFVQHVTNDVDEEISLLIRNAGGGGGGDGPWSESNWGFGSPDLSGNQVDFIRLIVHNINIQPYVLPEPFGDGLQWEAHFTWEFWGTPVPEPGTAALVFLALAAARGRRPRSV